MRYFLYTMLLCTLTGTIVFAATKGQKPPSKDSDKVQQCRQKIRHVIVIYEENWSFDGLYGEFPGADNLSNAGGMYQVDSNDRRMDTLPRPKRSIYGQPFTDDGRFASKLQNAPYKLEANHIEYEDSTGDLTHRFYNEQLQINGGKMDKYALYGENAGLVMSHFDATNLPEGKLAQKFTLCDRFFHSGFGGSFYNHIWLVAARPIWWDNPDPSVISVHSSPLLGKRDNLVDTDGHSAVNTCYTANWPQKIPRTKPTDFINSQKNIKTIGDLLDSANQTWAWYSGGFDDALHGRADGNFQYHHQPFAYFENFKSDLDTTKAPKHLKDENAFWQELRSGTLPSVSFIKAIGGENEHPGYTNIMRGQMHVDSIVQEVMKSKYWDDCVIIITYDENGGRWDHVAPPKIDKWGPGTRIPAIIISPYAKKGFIDHTQYETVSILKFIEELYGLPNLTDRDKNAANLLNAFDFAAQK